MNQRSFVSIILVIVIVIVIGTVGYFVFIKKSEPIIQRSASTSTLTSNTPKSDLSQIPVSDSNSAGVKTFLSQKLGVKFNYLASQGSPVIEEGDKIYVGGKGGQWVQEFSKSSNDGLKTAIKKKFLAGVSGQDCAVVDYGMSRAANIETAEIQFGFQLTGLDDPRIAVSPCPKDYRMTNGIRYFWMDKNNPDKFFFFNIGQDAILAESDQQVGGQKTWQNTFTVIK